MKFFQAFSMALKSILQNKMRSFLTMLGGAFDLAYMRPIPNLIVASPYNEHELRCLMYTAPVSYTHLFHGLQSIQSRSDFLLS